MKLFQFFNKANNKPTYKCACCGQEYEELPLCFGNDYPDFYSSIPPDERETRIELKESLCVVDGRHFFHRGRLTIPIIDYKENILFDVWSSISAENFAKRMDLWENPLRVNEKPYFGWLQTSLPMYGDTFNVKTIAVENQVGLIPNIISIEEGHPLTIDQENGITYAKAVGVVNEIMRKLHNTK